MAEEKYDHSKYFPRSALPAPESTIRYRAKKDPLFVPAAYAGLRSLGVALYRREKWPAMVAALEQRKAKILAPDRVSGRDIAGLAGVDPSWVRYLARVGKIPAPTGRGTARSWPKEELIPLAQKVQEMRRSPFGGKEKRMEMLQQTEMKGVVEVDEGPPAPRPVRASDEGLSRYLERVPDAEGGWRFPDTDEEQRPVASPQVATSAPVEPSPVPSQPSQAPVPSPRGFTALAGLLERLVGALERSAAAQERLADAWEGDRARPSSEEVEERGEAG